MATQRKWTAPGVSHGAVPSPTTPKHPRRPTSPISKTNFRPVDFAIHVELDKFFGQTAQQRRELRLHTRDENGRWWFDEAERDEVRGLLSPISPGPQASPARSSRRGSATNSMPCSPTMPYSFGEGSALGRPLMRRRSSGMGQLDLAAQPLTVSSPALTTGLAGLSLYTVVPLEAGGHQTEDEVLAGSVAGVPPSHGRRGSDQATTIAHDAPRTRAKRRHSTTVGTNVVGPYLQAPSNVEPPKDDADLIRLPAHLPLPHRLISSREMEEAFRPDPFTTGPHDSTALAPAAGLAYDVGRQVKRQRSVAFAPSLGSTDPGVATTPRRRPAQLDLTPHSTFTTLSGMEDVVSPAGGGPPSADASPVSARRTRTRRPQSAQGVPYFSTAGGLMMATSPSSGLAGAFSEAVRGLRTTHSPRPFANTVSPGGVSAASTSSSSGSNSADLSRGNSPTIQRGDSQHNKRRSLESSPTTRRRLSWSPFSSRRGDLGVEDPLSPLSPPPPGPPEQKYGSKSHAVLGMNPSNAHLLVPGGLGTGEEVYHGIVIDGPGVRLASDDEDSESGPSSKRKEKTLRRKATQWLIKGLVA